MVPTWKLILDVVMIQNLHGGLARTWVKCGFLQWMIYIFFEKLYIYYRVIGGIHKYTVNIKLGYIYEWFRSLGIRSDHQNQTSSGCSNLQNNPNGKIKNASKNMGKNTKQWGLNLQISSNIHFPLSYQQKQQDNIGPRDWFGLPINPN